MQVLRITKERFSKTNVDTHDSSKNSLARVCMSQLLSLRGPTTRKRYFRIERDERTTKVIQKRTIALDLIFGRAPSLVSAQFVINPVAINCVTDAPSSSCNVSLLLLIGSYRTSQSQQRGTDIIERDISESRYRINFPLHFVGMLLLNNGKFHSIYHKLLTSGMTRWDREHYLSATLQILISTLAVASKLRVSRLSLLSYQFASFLRAESPPRDSKFP